MADQIFDKMVYCLMAAVLVVPEPTTFIVCLLLCIGVASYFAGRTKAALRNVPSLIALVLNLDGRVQPAET